MGPIFGKSIYFFLNLYIISWKIWKYNNTPRGQVSCKEELTCPNQKILPTLSVKIRTYHGFHDSGCYVPRSNLARDFTLQDLAENQRFTSVGPNEVTRICLCGSWGLSGLLILYIERVCYRVSSFATCHPTHLLQTATLPHVKPPLAINNKENCSQSLREPF